VERGREEEIQGRRERERPLISSRREEKEGEGGREEEGGKRKGASARTPVSQSPLISPAAARR
jgi:hypothetical protein